jgi:hypothetical protein
LPCCAQRNLAKKSFRALSPGDRSSQLHAADAADRDDMPERLADVLQAVYR